MEVMISEDREHTIQKLQEYFQERPDVSMAFLFGSYIKGGQTSESDIDVAVYFMPQGKALEWEEDRTYTGEDSMWLDIDRIFGVNTDLVILNRAPATLASDILRTGVPVIIKDRNVYTRLLLLFSSAAEDFNAITKEWLLIKEHSRSLTEEDKARLARAADFLKDELAEIHKFKSTTYADYAYDRDKRRNLERWIENITNASIDIAKILLASEKKPLPRTYAEVLVALEQFEDFGAQIAQALGEFAKLRNILAHEYLDVRFSKIQRFLGAAEKVYTELISFVAKRVS